MPHHYTKNTVEAKAYCKTCGTFTVHYVWDGRLGRCKNDHHAVSGRGSVVTGRNEPAAVEQQGELFR